MYIEHENRGLPRPASARRLRRMELLTPSPPPPFAGGLKLMAVAVRNALWARYVARIV